MFGVVPGVDDMLRSLEAHILSPLMAALAVGIWRVLRAAGPYAEGGREARAGLAILAAFLTMGMFEYNFSDSEVLLILLFGTTLPFAASRSAAEDARDDRDGAPTL